MVASTPSVMERTAAGLEQTAAQLEELALCFDHLAGLSADDQFGARFSTYAARLHRRAAVTWAEAARRRVWLEPRHLAQQPTRG